MFGTSKFSLLFSSPFLFSFFFSFSFLSKELLQKVPWKEFFVSGTFNFRIFLKAPKKSWVFWTQLFNTLKWEFPHNLHSPCHKRSISWPIWKILLFFSPHSDSKQNSHFYKASVFPLLGAVCAETSSFSCKAPTWTAPGMDRACNATVNVVILQGFCLEFYSITYQPYWI